MEFKVGPYKDLIHEMMEKTSPYGEGLEPITEETRKEFKKAFSEIRIKFGSDIDAFFDANLNEAEDIVLDSLNTVISWKILNGKPITKLESAITGLFAFEPEIHNGGFHQYFFNSASDHWKDLYDIIALSGDSVAEERFKAVFSIFGKEGPSTDRGKRWNQLQEIEKSNEDQMWEHFDRHDSAFYDEPFPDIRKFFEFVRANKNAIEIEMI